MSLEKYAIGKVIGKGSYGEVFLAKHKKDKKQYVLKKVDLQKASIRERKAAELEAKLLSQLRHPNIVSYRESFQDDIGFLYIAMNFCEGGDLYTRLKTQKGTLLEENQIVEWFVQIAMALQYMHEKHILHRDLKTQNIFLTKSKIIKLGDLGIAKVLESSSDMATTLIGTPYYMSPELFSNKPYNHKSDVWALGCCLYEMCTLRHAFNAKDMSSLVYKILKGKTPPLPKLYSGDLCCIIKTMLDQDPEKRPSASRLLRHPYIKKQIALFLEGTKNRQKQKKNNSSGARIVDLPSNGPSSKSSSKSDSGYGGSKLESSIATVSGVDCILDEPVAPPKPMPRPNKSKPTPVERSSVESTGSSSSSSSDKGQTEIHIANEGNQQQKLERQKEQIRKQISERRKSAAERTPKEQRKSQPAAVAEEEAREQAADKRPVARVRSAGSARSPAVAEEARPSPSARPLPRPPVATPRSRDVPSQSKSPRDRRRYKVSSSVTPRQTSADDDDEDDDDDDRSTASVDSDRSLKSASESSQSCGMSARERRRLKQKSSAASIPSPVAASYNTPPLPSPRDLIAAARVRKSQESIGDGSPRLAGEAYRKSSAQDSVDGPPMMARPRPLAGQISLESSSSGSESNESDLEEISIDEPSSAQPPPRMKHRHHSDVSSLISALDTTLKLVDRSSDDRTSPNHSPSPTEDPTPTPLLAASPTTSGRLLDRIDRLRSDCVRGIGKEQLIRALRIIDALDEDDVEDALVDLMGRENFEIFGGAIWQLKFCEDFQIS